MDMAKMNWIGRAGRSLRRQAGSVLGLVIDGRSAPRLARLGDRARNDGHWAEAARHYAAARRLDPNNAALAVQLGHALKETGKLGAAENAYRDALTLRPLNADTWLMLGHCLKQQGRLADALDAYVRAHHLEPWAEHALREVIVLEGMDKAAPFAAINNSRLQRLVANLEEARDEIDRLAASLPALTSFASFAPANYDLYRKVHCLPAPAAAEAQLSLSLDLAGWTSLGLRRFLASLARQSFAGWRLTIHTGDAPHRDIAMLAAAADPRIAVDGDGPDDAGVWQMPIPGDVVLDDHALAWFAWTIANTAATTVYCDDDCVNAQDVHGAPCLRGMFDPIASARQRDRLALLVAKRSAVADESRAHIPLPLASRFVDGPMLPVPLPAIAVSSPTEKTGISVIVPTRDRLDLLKPCLDSLRARAGSGADIEIIVVDNGTSDPATLAYLREGEASRAFRVLTIDEPFNWARLNNLAARESNKPLLLFLNNDTECLTDSWDRVIADIMADPTIGVAGARLLYDDSTIQHAGIVFGFEHMAMHDGRHAAGDTRGPQDRWGARRAASAVTGACLATPRALFESLGGFDERRFAISYNDIDYCLRARAAGKLVAYEPRITFVHYESKSRGLDVLDPAKHQRDEEEARVLRMRWGDALLLEPSASPHWARFAPPFTALAMPSLDRIVGHVLASARPNPWKVEPADPA